MGSGGSTTNNIVYQAISDKHIGGEYRDSHISTVQSSVYKNISVAQIDQILLNHKLPKQKLIQTQKLKFAAKGISKISNLSYNSHFFMEYTIKYQQLNSKMEILMSHFRYTGQSPYTKSRQLSTTIQHMMVRWLSNDQQNKIIQAIKSSIKKMKILKQKDYQGKFRVYDMVVKSIVHERSDFFLYYFDWIQNDEQFINYLKKKGQNKLANAIVSIKISEAKQIHARPYQSPTNKFILNFSQALAQSVLNSLKNTEDFVKIEKASVKMQELSKAYHQLAKNQKKAKLMSRGVWSFILNRFCLGTLPTSDINYNALYNQSFKGWNGYFPVVGTYDLFLYIIGFYDDDYGKCQDSQIKK